MDAPQRAAQVQQHREQGSRWRSRGARYHRWSAHRCGAARRRSRSCALPPSRRSIGSARMVEGHRPVGLGVDELMHEEGSLEARIVGVPLPRCGRRDEVDVVLIASDSCTSWVTITELAPASSLSLRMSWPMMPSEIGSRPAKGLVVQDQAAGEAPPPPHPPRHAARELVGMRLRRAAPKAHRLQLHPAPGRAPCPRAGQLCSRSGKTIVRHAHVGEQRARTGTACHARRSAWTRCPTAAPRRPPPPRYPPVARSCAADQARAAVCLRRNRFAMHRGNDHMAR